MLDNTKEANVLTAIMKFSKLKKLAVLRMQTSGTLRSRGKTSYMTKSTSPGFPDLIWLFRGFTYYIEAKSETGKLSPNQEKFRKLVNAHDCVYVVVRSLDQFKEFVNIVMDSNTY